MQIRSHSSATPMPRECLPKTKSKARQRQCQSNAKPRQSQGNPNVIPIHCKFNAKPIPRQCRANAKCRMIDTRTAVPKQAARTAVGTHVHVATATTAVCIFVNYGRTCVGMRTLCRRAGNADSLAAAAARLTYSVSSCDMLCAHALRRVAA